MISKNHVKYCILSLPRTGSTWLSAAISNSFYTTQNFINLGEFINPGSGSDVLYKLEDGFIRSYPGDLVIDDYRTFIKDRIEMLVNNNNTQPTVLKYMIWPFKFPDIDYAENLKKIADSGYRIISLDRDLFDCAVSFTVMTNSGFSHRWRVGVDKFRYTGELIEGMHETPPEFQSITISENDFKSYYTSYLVADSLKSNLENLIECTKINYDTMGLDCYRAKVPFGVHSHHIKLYDLPYSKLVNNYDNLLEIKERIDKRYGK